MGRRWYYRRATVMVRSSCWGHGRSGGRRFLLPIPASQLRDVYRSAVSYYQSEHIGISRSMPARTSSMSWLMLLIRVAMILLLPCVAADPVGVANSPVGGSASAWRVVSVGKSKPTLYRVASVAKSPAIEARVDSSMALLARPIKVDLAQTPVLCWRWWVQNAVAKGDIRKKAGNDFAARVYVSFDMPDSALSAGAKMKLGMARRVLGMAVPDAAVTYVWDTTARSLALKSRLYRSDNS